MPRIQRKVLISSVQFEDKINDGTMSVLEIAPIAKRLGADGVEYREVFWRDKERELPMVIGQLSELGLMATYATFTPLLSLENHERLLVDIEDAVALGSPVLRVFRGPYPEPDKEERAIQAAEAALRRAAEAGLALALENHIGALGNKLSDVKGATERFAPLGLRVNIDTSNYVINEQDLMGAIELFSPLIAYSHLKDVKITPDGRSVTYLGDGDLDFPAILAAYDRTGRDFPICFEFRGGSDPEARIVKSLDYLRSIGGRNA